MDEVDNLIHRFRVSPRSKWDSLLRLERIREQRVLEFLLHVLADPLEPLDVRLYVLKHTRNGRLAAEERPRVARAYLELLGDRARPDLRLQAILALGGFTDVDGVANELGEVVRRGCESFDMRYAALTALERGGPTPEYLAVLRELVGDEVLGNAARSALRAWSERSGHLFSQTEETLP